MAELHRHRSGYTKIPGSSALTTGRADDNIVALEKSEPARVGSVDVRGHKLGRVVLRDAFIPVVADVFDVLALDQEPEELAVYMHLWRLSVGEERNFCRVSRAELERRVCMSQLRLGKALAGLVAKRHIALVDRNREGTLYRVYLPSEVARAEPVPLPAAAPTTSAKSSVAPHDDTARKPRARAQPSVSRAPTVGELVEWLAKHGGSGRGRPADEVLEEVLGLVEDGVETHTIQRALERFVAELPKQTPISELRRFI